MKKLTKKSLEELAQVMPVLSEVEMRECVGGDIIRMGLDGTIKIVPNDEKVDYIMVSSDLNATKWGKRIDMPPGTSIMPNPPGGSGNLEFLGYFVKE